jgi:hypothetical protein
MVGLKNYSSTNFINYSGQTYSSNSNKPIPNRSKPRIDPLKTHPDRSTTWRSADLIATLIRSSVNP